MIEKLGVLDLWNSLKALISGILVASVSMMALRNATMAALLMGIPFTASLSLAMIFMWYSGIDAETFAKFSFETTYFVLTSPVFFVIFGLLVTKIGFWCSVIVRLSVTIILYNILLRII